jgi:hypothetical protein
MMAQWAKICRRILIVNIDYQHMLCYWLIKLLYYRKTQRDGAYQNNLLQSSSFHAYGHKANYRRFSRPQTYSTLLATYVFLVLQTQADNAVK